MKLQYFTSVHTDTEEVKHLLKNKRNIKNMPFDTDVNGKYYESITLDGKKAYLIVEEERYLTVYY